MNSGSADAVANSRRQMLEQTLAEVRARVAVLEAALDPAHRQFTGRPVWVGPKARTFTEDLIARRARLRQAAQAILDALEEELRTIPRAAGHQGSR
ncbi:hypothetical protein ACFQ08_00725 [Streptosporangium algeriense]|uniref:Uncharacterized protein n=1 Tax=Streptosporangium algeriense TaxID=1682748 RepID=A0ABW3DGT9_9ACTN